MCYDRVRYRMLSKEQDTLWEVPTELPRLRVLLLGLRALNVFFALGVLVSGVAL